MNSLEELHRELKRRRDANREWYDGEGSNAFYAGQADAWDSAANLVQQLQDSTAKHMAELEDKIYQLEGIITFRKHSKVSMEKHIEELEAALEAVRDPWYSSEDHIDGPDGCPPNPCPACARQEEEARITASKVLGYTHD